MVSEVPPAAVAKINTEGNESKEQFNLIPRG